MHACIQPHVLQHHLAAPQAIITAGMMDILITASALFHATHSCNLTRDVLRAPACRLILGNLPFALPVRTLLTNVGTYTPA